MERSLDNFVDFRAFGSSSREKPTPEIYLHPIGRILLFPTLTFL